MEPFLTPELFYNSEISEIIGIIKNIGYHHPCFQLFHYLSTIKYKDI